MFLGNEGSKPRTGEEIQVSLRFEEQRGKGNEWVGLGMDGCREKHLNNNNLPTKWLEFQLPQYINCNCIKYKL